MTILLPKDVAGRWHCSERTVRNMIKDGRLPGLRIGEKLLRVRLEDVEHYECQMIGKSDASEAPSSSSSGETVSATVTRLEPATRLKLRDVRHPSTNT